LARAAETVFKNNPNAALIAINTDGSGKNPEKLQEIMNAVRKVIEAKQTTHQCYVWANDDYGPLEKAFAWQGNPYNILIDTNGKILGVIDVKADPELGAAEIKQQIDAVLAQLK